MATPAVPRLEAFERRADRAITKQDLALAELIQRRRFLLPGDLVGYMTSVIADASPNSRMELEKIADEAGQHFTKLYMGTPMALPEKLSTDPAALKQSLIASALSSDAWRLTLQGIASREAGKTLSGAEPGVAATSHSKPGRKPGFLVDGEKLKAYRGATKQAELAERSGYNLSTIQRGESGGLWSEETFKAVAVALTTKTGKIVTAADLKKPQK